MPSQSLTIDMGSISDTKKHNNTFNDTKHNKYHSSFPMTITTKLSLKKFLHTTPYYYYPIKNAMTHQNLTKYIQVYFVDAIINRYHYLRARTMPSSNSNYQAMLQKGINGYLEETRPDMIKNPTNTSSKTTQPTTTLKSHSTNTNDAPPSSSSTSTQQTPKDRCKKKTKNFPTKTTIPPGPLHHLVPTPLLNIRRPQHQCL